MFLRDRKQMKAVQAQRLLMPTEGAALERLLPEATFSICKLRLASVVSLGTAIVICTCCVREIFSPQIFSPIYHLSIACLRDSGLDDL